MTDTTIKNSVVTHSSVKFWIPIIILAIACTTAFAVVQERVATLTSTMVIQVERIDTLTETFVEIRVQLAEIQKDVSYLRQQKQTGD